jgi:hypothetical protein
MLGGMLGLELKVGLSAAGTTASRRQTTDNYHHAPKHSPPDYYTHIARSQILLHPPRTNAPQSCLTTAMISCKTPARRSKSRRQQHSTPSDNRRYDFEYEDDDEEQSGDVDIENKYYNAKQLKADDPETAIEEFAGMPALEEEKSEWYGRQTSGATDWR